MVAGIMPLIEELRNKVNLDGVIDEFRTLACPS
jgi:hypothetical protein